MAKLGKLFEGFSEKAATAVRSYFAREYYERSESPARGYGRVPSIPTSPYASTQGVAVSDLVAVSDELLRRYADYEEMDQYPEISTALDIYADDATSPSMEAGVAIWATSNDEEVKRNLNNLLHRRLYIEDEIWSLARTLCKYGNNFGEILTTENGVVGIQFLPPAMMRRVEDNKGALIGFVQTSSARSRFTVRDFLEAKDGKVAGAIVFEDWEVVHWRIRGKDQNSVYGSSIIDPARWVWKRLSLLEDALLLYKLQRAPARYAFYIDVGSMDNRRGLAYVEQVKNRLKRRPFFNPRTGSLDMRYNPLAMDEDFFIPVRDGKRATEIEVLSGPDYSETDTLEYHRDKLVSALSVPKSYMGYGGEATRGPLSSESIQFARKVMRVQASIRAGFRKVFRVHLAAIGKDPDVYDFDAVMNTPSQIMDLARMEVLNSSADLAQRLGEMLPIQWVFERVFGFTSEEAERLIKAKEEEKKAQAGGGRGGFGFESARQNGQQLAEWSELFTRMGDKLASDRGKGDFDRLDERLSELLRHDKDLERRLRSVEGLLKDVVRNGGHRV